MVEITLDRRRHALWAVSSRSEGERAVIQVFEGTSGISLNNTGTRFTGHPMELALSPEILGRIFNGAGRPIDGLGEIYRREASRISTASPSTRSPAVYPRNYIRTGISAIDALMPR